ncbi:hypothetical protein [Methanobrevibacter arboriphilus]|uniref:hypothetical protein n=1 Tax=Methanobrevibacter arboriphilus TaxID=39441 RepID=UPI001CDAAAC7|nr:hypothetical protein [Methanobrevibacter arboriphilus]
MPTISITVGAISGLIVYIILRKKNLPEKKLWGAIVPVVIGNTAFFRISNGFRCFWPIRSFKSNFFMIWVL